MEENKVEKDVVETTSNNQLQSDERNKNLGFWGSIVQGFKNFFLDLKASFVYNKMKLAAILVGVPGVLLGFFIGVHRTVIDGAAFFANEQVYNAVANRLGPFNGPILYTANDMTAICFFLLMLLGILNLFTAVGMSGKKNLGSVVTATASTVAMTIIVAVYLFFIFMSVTYVSKGYVLPATNPDGTSSAINTSSIQFIMVMISCIGSVVCSIVGCVLGFINYDRTYKKSDAR